MMMAELTTKLTTAYEPDEGELSFHAFQGVIVAEMIVFRLCYRLDGGGGGAEWVTFVMLYR
jgi:hypothetical protein